MTTPLTTNLDSALSGLTSDLPVMPQMPIKWESDEAAKRASLKPYLLLALTVAVLAFCTTLLVR